MRMNGSWHLYRPERALAASGARHARAGRHGERGGGRVQHSRRGIPHGRDLRAAQGSCRARSGSARRDSIALKRQARIRARAPMSIADVLLDQRVIAGIGNVFKSEILFVAGVASVHASRELSTTRRSIACSTSRSKAAPGERPGSHAHSSRRRADAGRRAACIRAKGCGCTDAAGSRAGDAARRIRSQERPAWTRG